MNKQEIIEIDKHLIQAEIINEIDRLRELKKVSKSDLADILEVKRPFVSQLYSGDRFFNIEHLAKIQRAFDIKLRLSFIDAEEIRVHNDPKRFWIDSTDMVYSNTRDTQSVLRPSLSIRFSLKNVM